MATAAIKPPSPTRRSRGGRSAPAIVSTTRRIRKGWPGALLLLLLAAWAAPAAAVEIAVTLPPLAGLARTLAPDADVVCLLKGGSDPHAAQLTPRQVERLRRAALLIRSSADDGHWDGIDPEAAGAYIDLWPRESHAWLRPDLVREVLPRLAEALGRALPGRAAAIDARLADALASADDILRRWRAALAPLRTRGVVMQHPAWSPLCTLLGVPVLAVLEPRHHHREAGPHVLEQGLAALRDHPDALLWGSVRHSNRALEWLRNRREGAGTELVRFDALGRCGMSWEELMRDNLARLPAP